MVAYELKIITPAATGVLGLVEVDRLATLHIMHAPTLSCSRSEKGQRNSGARPAAHDQGTVYRLSKHSVQLGAACAIKGLAVPYFCTGFDCSKRRKC